ncbi:MAG: hypothetical protein M1838_000941 [Thelocarpon superellum]|nr:MAG: hypothetical protein M1838_000941 [Thelocarpon superellum]
MLFSTGTLAVLGSIACASLASARPQDLTPNLVPGTPLTNTTDESQGSAVGGASRGFKLYAKPAPASAGNFSTVLPTDKVELTASSLADDGSAGSGLKILGGAADDSNYAGPGEVAVSSRTVSFALNANTTLSVFNHTDVYEVALNNYTGGLADFTPIALVTPGTGSTGFSFSGPNGSLANSDNPDATWTRWPVYWNQNSLPWQENVLGVYLVKG